MLKELLDTLDLNVFLMLNGSLVNHPTAQMFWGLLNHKWEAILNLIMAFSFNLIILLCTRDKALRKTRFFQLLYFWFCFELGFFLQDGLFHTLLDLKRLSPSLLITPVLRLSEALHNPLIKDFSEHSFPSGHAFAMIYWSSFTYLCSPKKAGILALALGIFFCIPRLVGGGHWLSDVLVGALLALVWLWFIIKIPLYRFIISKSPTRKLAVMDDSSRGHRGPPLQ
jgi:membrane-associated phospholipid phosphatase